MEALIKIQSELKAPKSQFNNFGKYNYRNCEDILEAVKPLLLENKCLLFITDKVIELNNGIYVEAKATFKHLDFEVSVTAQAGIDITKKGMDHSQCYGSSSSYARKYALNGLFLIDDTKDSDNTNDHGKKQETPQKQENNPYHFDNFEECLSAMLDINSHTDIVKIWKNNPQWQKEERFINPIKDLQKKFPAPKN